MDVRRFGEASVLHFEPETYAKLLHLVATGPGRPGGTHYDPENPWHALIVEPHMTMRRSAAFTRPLVRGFVSSRSRCA